MVASPATGRTAQNTKQTNTARQSLQVAKQESEADDGVHYGCTDVEGGKHNSMSSIYSSEKPRTVESIKSD